MRQKKDNDVKSVQNKIVHVLGNTLKNVQKCYRSSGRRTYIPQNKNLNTARVNRTNCTAAMSNNSDKRSISKNLPKKGLVNTGSEI